MALFGRFLAICLLSLSATLNASNALELSNERPHIVAENFRTAPFFEQNVGQADRRFAFVSRGGPYAISVADQEIVLTFAQTRAGDAEAYPPERPLIDKLQSSVFTEVIEAFRHAPRRNSDNIVLGFAGANPSPTLIGEGLRSSVTNIYASSNPAEWLEYIRQYTTVRYQDLYPHIDAIANIHEDGIKLDFVVAPGGNPSEIVLDMSDADSLYLVNQQEIAFVVDGEQFRLSVPAIYQEYQGDRELIDGAIVDLGNHQIGFHIGDYDTSRDLVIDPLVVDWEKEFTKNAPGGNDMFMDVVDHFDGGVVAVGIDDNGLSADDQLQSQCVIARIDEDGVWGNYTLFGASQFYICDNIDTDLQGNVVIGGVTTGPDLPLLNPFQSSFIGGFADAFIARFSADLTLTFSSYLGGSGTDYVSFVEILGSDGLVVAGTTESANFPVFDPIAAFQGEGDMYLAEFTFDLVEQNNTWANPQLEFSTFLGGELYDSVNDADVDGSTITIVGSTSSDNFPETLEDNMSFQDQKNLGVDGIIVNIDMDDKEILSSTYFGGSKNDTLTAVKVLGNRIYVAGHSDIIYTNTGLPQDIPFLVDLQPSEASSVHRGSYFAVLDRDLQELLRAARIGNQARANDIQVDFDRRIFVTGHTKLRFPDEWTSVGPEPEVPHDDDIFVAEIIDDGRAAGELVYLGTGTDDFGLASALTVDGTMYVVGGVRLLGEPDSAPAVFKLELPELPIGFEFPFQSSAKIVCGDTSEVGAFLFDELPVIDEGHYATSINITNPQDEPVLVETRLSVSWPEFGSAPNVFEDYPPSIDAGTALLDPSESWQVSCSRFESRFAQECPACTALFEGYLHIDSEERLDVIGVYTARLPDDSTDDEDVPDEETISIDVEHYESRDRRRFVDIGVYTKELIMRRSSGGTCIFTIESDVINYGRTDAENLEVADRFSSINLDGGPDLLVSDGIVMYSVTHGGQWTQIFERLGVDVTIPRLPAGQTASIVRTIVADSNSDQLESKVIVSNLEGELVLNNNSFNRHFWLPVCP